LPANLPAVVTLLAGRGITKSFGSRLILDGADLAIELLEVDGGMEASDGDNSAWVERRAAATG
jgi:hypothetical protein